MTIHPKGYSSFWEHIEQLRKTLVSSFLTIFIGTACCFVFREPLFDLLTSPLSFLEKAEEVQSHSLLILGPLEGFSTALRVCFWVSLVATAPIWSYLLLSFIAPALNKKEQIRAIPFVLLSFLAISLGIAFAYFATIPLTNCTLYQFNASIGVNFWTLSNYLNYTLFLLLANALAFEGSLVLLFLVHYGYISAEFLSSNRRSFAVASFFLAALLTPPDILSQMMLAGPLLLLTEVAIFYAKVRAKMVLKIKET